MAAATRSSGTVARERLGLDDDQAHVVRDDVVELLGDPHALLRDRALGQQLALALAGARRARWSASTLVAPAAHVEPEPGA